MDDFFIVFDGYEYWAVPDEIYLDQIHDSLLDLYGSSSQSSKGSGGSAAGIVIGSVFAGIIVCVAVGAVVFVSSSYLTLNRRLKLIDNFMELY